MGKRTPKQYYTMLSNGTQESPMMLHHTVARAQVPDAEKWAMTATDARNRAIAQNIKDGKDRHKEWNRIRDIFDKKRPREFWPPEGMKSRALFWGGQEVYFVRAKVQELNAEKGVVITVEWDRDTKTWYYWISYWARIPKGKQREPGQLWEERWLYAQEHELFSLSNKAAARQLVIDTLATMHKWFADFFSRLTDFKHGDIEPGEELK